MKAAWAFSTLLLACLTLWAAELEDFSDFVPAPETRDEFFVGLLVAEWIGRPVDELITTWGPATKLEIQPDGGQRLVYRMRFVEGFQFTPDHHVALSIDGPYPVAGIYIEIPGKPAPKVVGKLKARFHADEHGEIVDVEILYLKWIKSGRRKRQEEQVAEEPLEPREPFKADVEVDPHRK